MLTKTKTKTKDSPSFSSSKTARDAQTVAGELAALARSPANLAARFAQARAVHGEKFR
jgi:hypothetical protein